MANRFPVFSMGQMQRQRSPASASPPRMPASAQPAAPPPVSPPPPPVPTPPPPPVSPPPVRQEHTARPNLLSLLPEGLHADRDTLLLIALAWLLWQEKADRRLILALLYILM